MTSRERKDQITLRQASCILQGARPPGKTRDRRDQCRTIVNGAIESIAEATANHYLATLNPGEWEKLAGLPADYEVFDAPEWLPGFGLEQTLEWIASAPEPHVRLAVEIGVWRTPYRQALLERLLAGQAPIQRASGATQAGAGGCDLIQRRGLALLCRPAASLLGGLEGQGQP
jgi:hypothetical protein